MANYLAVGSQSGEIDLWDIGRERLLGTIPAPAQQRTITALEFSGLHLIATYGGTDVRIFDMHPQSWTAIACRLTAGVRGSGEAAGLIGEEPTEMCPQ
jgi:hypothetical protein